MSSVSGEALSSPAPESGISLPRGWSRIALAGIESAVVQWAICVSVVAFAYWLELGNQWLANTGWTVVFSFATKLWSGALFGSYPLGRTMVTLLPSGLTLLCVGIAQLGLSLRRGVDSAALLVFPFCYAVMAVLICAYDSSNGILRVACGSFLVGLFSALLQLLWRVRKYRRDMDRELGLVSDYRADDVFLNWIIERPRNIFRGLASSWQLLMVMFAIGALAFVFAVAMGWPRVIEIAGLLGASKTESVFLVLAQLLYLPLYLACAVSWLAGAGFYTGVGALHTSFLVPDQALPAVPVLGAIPASPVQAWPSLWVPFLFLGIYGAWRSARSLIDLRTILLMSGLMTAIFEALFCWVASGSIGPGTMQFVGLAFPISFGLIFAQTWGVYALMRLLGSVEVIAFVRRTGISLRDYLSGLGNKQSVSIGVNSEDEDVASAFKPSSEDGTDEV